MSAVKRGTARRLGLRAWTGERVVLARLDVPGDAVRYVVLVGSRYRQALCDEAGRCVAGPAVNIGAGMLRTDREVVYVRPSTVGGTDDVRDAIAAANPDFAGLVMSRDQVVEKWCRDHGKDKNSLEMMDILAIRSRPEWINAG